MDYIYKLPGAVAWYAGYLIPTGAQTATPVKTKFVEKSTGLVQLMGPELNWIRVAGLAGALAVALGAYGEHGLKPDFPAQRKRVFDTANRYHILHSLALMAVPLTNRPNIVGPLILGGMAVFCGTCYVHALTGNEGIIRFTPLGGWALILGWLSMML